MSLRVYYEVLNQKGSPALFTDTFANRPAFGFQGRLFISTDTGQIFEDTGTAWTLVADAGVGSGTLSSVCTNGNTTATGIVITAGGLSSTTGTFSGIVTTPQVKASTSAGLSINANSGTQVADFGAGGSANITLFGGLSGTSASFSSSITGNTIVKSGGTAAQILAADGSVITAGTNITISGGLISSTGGGGGMAIGGSITSATAGSVLFAGASGVLQQDNANFFWDDTNNRLGLGISSPTTTLDVNGLVRIRTNASSFNTPLFVENTGTAAVGNKNVAVFIGARGNASNLDDNTNIGVWQKDTTNNNYGLISFFNSGGNVCAFIGTQYLSHGTSPSGNLIFATVAAGIIAQKMSLFSTGNLAINSTTDNGQGLLQVSGNIYVTGIGAAGSTYSVSSTLSTAYYHVFTGAAGQTLTLPSPASNNVQYVIINNTANTVTVAAATSTNIVTTAGTSVASITLIANQRVFILANGGTNYFQIF